MTKPLTPSRRAFLAWAGSGAALLLAGCGGSSVASRLNPQRFLIVGDGFCDQGQTGSLPTVNDGSPTWLQQMAAYYNNVAPVKPANQGGTAWAQAYALLASPDTASGTNAPSVQTQIGQMLAATKIANNDLVFINGGIADIMQAITQTGISAATSTAVQTAATTLAGQVRQLTQSGGTHVVVTGVYDISISPWAVATGLNIGDISKLTVDFNDQLLIAINDLGSTVLYLDAALFYNLVYSSPQYYALTNVTTPVCTTPTALTCNTNTLSDSNYSAYMFADDRHFTPAVQLMFGSSNYGSNGYQRLIDRW
ncbi:MAG: GDSL family lipase [Burkholderiaceae bacterium]|jgi:phospholipase/lecithinase/hemolysin|nr:GDSL family lipase [Burkholderiaceae bacterium]